jgi:hypothetical protein
MKIKIPVEININEHTLAYALYRLRDVENMEITEENILKFLNWKIRMDISDSLPPIRYDDIKDKGLYKLLDKFNYMIENNENEEDEKSIQKEWESEFEKFIAEKAKRKQRHRIINEKISDEEEQPSVEEKENFLKEFLNERKSIDFLKNKGDDFFEKEEKLLRVYMDIDESTKINSAWLNTINDENMVKTVMDASKKINSVNNEYEENMIRKIMESAKKERRSAWLNTENPECENYVKLDEDNKDKL